MKQIFVRNAKPEDAQEYAKWAPFTEDACLDAGVLAYPTTRTLVAHAGKPLVYLPVQLAAMLESVAVSPDASPLEIAESYRQLVKSVVFAMNSQGVREIYFLSKHPTVIKMATDNGFEVVPLTCLRLKLDDIEKV